MARDALTPDERRARLRHVRWIGGGTGAGKSSVTQRLAEIHGLVAYNCDDSIRKHAHGADPSQSPLLEAFLEMDMNQRWVTRPPRVMFETFPWFHGEGFELILDDLMALGESTPILVEGFRLLPRLIAPLLIEPNHGVWLIPTREFRREAFMARGITWFPYETNDPDRAMVNLLMRDRIFTDQVAKEATDLNLPVLRISRRLSMEVVTRRVADFLGLAIHLAPGLQQRS